MAHLLIATLVGHTALRAGGHWLRDVVELATIGLVLGALYVLATSGPDPVWLLVALGALALEQYDRRSLAARLGPAVQRRASRAGRLPRRHRSRQGRRTPVLGADVW